MTPVETVVHLLTLETEWRDPNPERSLVTAREHALQVATRALRSGAPEREVIGGLVHDAARPLTDVNHGQAIAWIVGDQLGENVFLALFYHGSFQTDIVHDTSSTDVYRDLSWYATAKRLATWDAASFDPNYQALPLSTFVPMLERVLA